MLATLDPLAAMADVDGDALTRLIANASLPIDLKAMFPDVDIAGILDNAGDSLSLPQEWVEPPERDSMVRISFDVPNDHKWEIVRRIRPILVEYDVEVPEAS